MDNARYGELLWTFNTGGMMTHFDKIELFQELADTKQRSLMPAQQTMLDRLVELKMVILPESE